MSRHRCRLALRRTTALVAAVGLAAATPAAAQRATLDRATRQQVLDNGMQVIVVENHAVPIATVMVTVRGGAMTQGEDDQGIPHLFEHMLFKGYRGAHDQTFGQEASRLLAGYNGETSDETVSYYLTLPSDRVTESVGLLADLIREPRFVDADLKTERFVVLGEFQRNLSVPRFNLSRELDKMLWGASFARKNTIGEQSAVLGVTTRRLEEIFRQYYVPNNAALVVTGDVAAAKVFEAARDQFGGWRRQADPFVKNPVPTMARLEVTRSAVVTADVKEVTVMMRWQGPSVRANSDATYAADVLADLVNDNDSPFQKRLVDGGAFQSASLSYQTLSHVGPITFVGVTTWERLSGALTVLSGEFELMRDSAYFEATALEVAKKRRVVNTALEQEEGASLANSLGHWWSVAGLDYYLGYVDHLSSRSASDLRRFVNAYIAEKPYVLGVLVRPEQGPQAQLLLNEFNKMMESK